MWQFPRREILRSSVMMKEAVQTHTENVHVNENAFSNAEVRGGGEVDVSPSYLNTTDESKLYRYS